MIRLISLDVDGTLLDSRGNLPEENRAAIRAAVDRGTHVILNTGKPLSAVDHIAEMVDYCDPVVAVGGALIVARDDEGKWRICQCTALPEPAVDVFSEMLVDTALTAVFLTAWRVYIYSRDRSPEYGASMLRWLALNDMNDYTTIDRPTFLSRAGIEGPILNIVLHEEDRQGRELELVHEKLREAGMSGIEMQYSNVGTLNITPSGAGKMQAIEFLCSELGVKRDEVLALGDYESDLEVVNWAGCGAIMGNALPLVKAKAPRIAPSNDQCGVAWMIDEYVLGKRLP